MIRYYQDEDNFNRYFVYALVAHVAVVILFYLFQVLMDMNILKFRTPPQEIEVIKAAVKVDIVGMPKNTLKELSHINLNQTTVEEEIEKPQEVKEPETEKVFKQKAKKVNLNDLLKDFSKKKIKTKKTKKEKKKLNQTALRQLVLEGNKVSKGSNVTGDILDMKNQAFVEYVQGLPDQIRPYWKLPSYLADKNLKCRIRVYISKSGQVLRSEVIEPSGEQEYDLKALAAIKRASPLNVPAKEILTRVSTGQVVLGFPL